MNLDPIAGGGRRRRVLVGAYACGPGDEPEASAGWAFVCAAAETNDVWVFTRKRFEPSISAVLELNPELATRLTVTYIDLSDRLVALKRHSYDLYWYYAMWQRELGRHAVALHAEVRFDLMHHVTFANDWLPCGLLRVKDVPFVWGPVGGATKLPLLRTARWLGARGVATELMRNMGTWLPRRIFGDAAAHRSSVLVAQNDDVARRFSFAKRVVVEPNACLSDPPAVVRAPKESSAGREALFVGRLIGLKAPRLALETLARPESARWRLSIYGDGYERRHLERLVNRLGLRDRVTFLGHRPRAEVLAAYGRADALLFPSLHDQAGWAVAEASSAGCTVVCLPLGGPPVLARPNDFVAPLSGDIAGNLARALDSAGDSTGVRHNRWSTDRLPGLLDDWYGSAIADASSADLVRIERA